MNILNKRQVIILAAFCLPLFALIAISYSGSRQTGIPKPPPEVRARPAPAVKPSASLAAERKRIKALLKEAVAMTPEQYLERKKTDPAFEAPNVEIRRERLSHRLAQLEHMTPEQWQTDPLRLRNNPPKPEAADTQTPAPEKLPPAKP